MVGQTVSGWSTVRLRQIRFVPFYIGTEIDDDLIKKIDEVMPENNYKKRDLEKHSEILPSGVSAYDISGRHQLFVFRKGICVSVLTDEEYNPEDFFSIKSCQERIDAHRGILTPEKDPVERYRKDGDEIRAIERLLVSLADEQIRAMSRFKRGRKTALTRWESFNKELNESKKGGLSYVMTLHVITPTGAEPFGNLDWNDIPKQMRRNIKVLLDPAIIDLEDTSESVGDIEGKKKLMANINLDSKESEEKDYEKRENLATFMSWSSVVVVGMPTENEKENDIEEYVILEVILQSNWYLIHRKEKTLPSTIEEAKKRKYTAAEMRMDQYKLDRYLEETTYHSGSTLPARFNDIQKGLLSSSRLSIKTARYKRMAKDVSESMMYDYQLRQSRYGGASEILLLIIAVLNAATIVYSLANNTHGTAVAAAAALVIVVGAYAAWRRYW